ncbi:MAG: hypothetical protein JXB32_09800 [Deltaproteobacteria bacterium]|nr:hypothetical protein [Deltaproteobacteria bacterium]
MTQSLLLRGTMSVLLAALALGCDDGGTTLAGDVVDDGAPEDAGPETPVEVAPDVPADVPVEAEDGAADAPADTSDAPDGPRTRPVDLTPDCVHVPALVGAGGPFPIAVLGETAGCVEWSRAEVSASDFEIDVRLVGREDLVGPCPGCLFTYVGLVWLEAPTPGAYTVRVAGWPDETVVASGGAYEDPVCQTDCPVEAAPGTRSWTLARVSAGDVHSGCDDYVNVGTAVSFAGSCREWTASGADWTFPARTLCCTDADVFFGPSAPYEVDATLCPDGARSRILGIAQRPGTADPPTELFLLESD